MQVSLARFESQSPDWTAIGGVIAAGVLAVSGVIAGFKKRLTPDPLKPDPPRLPPHLAQADPTQDGGTAIATLQRLAARLENQSDTLFKRVGEQDSVIADFRVQIGVADDSMRNLRRQLGEQDIAIQTMSALAARYRAKLIKAGVDPED